MQNDLNAKQTEMDANASKLLELEEALNNANATIAERDQTITDLNAQIEQLQNEPGHQPKAGAAPDKNGGGAEGPQLVVDQYVYDPALSYKENRELEEKWNAEHGK